MLIEMLRLENRIVVMQRKRPGIILSCVFRYRGLQGDGTDRCDHRFSSPHALDALAFALRNQIPIVIATTGFPIREKIAAAADHIPVFHSKNMSLGQYHAGYR